MSGHFQHNTAMDFDITLYKKALGDRHSLVIKIKGKVSSPKIYKNLGKP